MNNKNYFEKLIEYAKSKDLEVKHYDNNHYIRVKSFKDYSFSFVISSSRSRAYGNLIGFVVELYISNTEVCELYLEQLKKYKNEIENELGELTWQNREETAKGTVTRVYSKLSVDVEDEDKWDEYINWQVNKMKDFLEVFPKYTNKLEKTEGTFISEKEAKRIIERFIENDLKRNENDEYDNEKFIELETSTGQKFVIYKKNTEKSIFVKPKNGNKNFSEAIQRIIDYEVYKNSSHHNDASYIIPIADKIFRNTQSKTINIESLEYVIANYSLDKKVDHYFRLDNQEKLYPRRYIVNEAAKKQGIITEYDTNEAKKILENIFRDRIEFLSNPKIGNEMKIKNIILYGAPGVGKTHNYKKLISLIEKDELPQKEIFKEIENSTEKYEIEEFDDELKSRVEFITFHQSFGYEDFIEGFRPNEEGKIQLEDGIFKVIKNNANRTEKIVEDISQIDFNDYLEVGQELFSMHGKKITIVDINDDIVFEYSSTGNKSIALRDTIIKVLQNEDAMNNERWYASQVDIAREIYRKLNIKKVEQKNFYLVIDEINRGNISKIFGELITLIEESKRDNYEVTLPYSKEKFKVPSNLYIIGTMNTTDKSIALIDVALRRRFTFIKMKPNSTLVISSFKDTFEKLNEQIKKDLGEEYQIGHSYFMNINESDLDFVKEYKIKPLLEEYYYGDEDKLNVALEIIGLKESIN